MRSSYRTNQTDSATACAGCPPITLQMAEKFEQWMVYRNDEIRTKARSSVTDRQHKLARVGRLLRDNPKAWIRFEAVIAQINREHREKAVKGTKPSP